VFLGRQSGSPARGCPLGALLTLSSILQQSNLHMQEHLQVPTLYDDRGWILMAAAWPRFRKFSRSNLLRHPDEVSLLHECRAARGRLHQGSRLGFLDECAAASQPRGGTLRLAGRSGASAIICDGEH